MSDENKESRVNVEDLPRGEQELSREEAQGVAGGEITVKMPDLLVSSYQSGGAGGIPSTADPALKTK
jgi:hypothetical protein